MPRKKDLAYLEQQAAQMERKAKEMRDEVARLKRERRERENRDAGAALRKLWDRWPETTLDDVEAALTEVFGPPPAGQEGETVGVDSASTPVDNDADTAAPKPSQTEDAGPLWTSREAVAP